eukprot:CAMPEP_0117759892 /NCGR_PEP_ID=MMETSP0947-20121206/16276_1 /TAXON_ID=44440 /ORGANISM="Chattonella subsalsa, Strain CCMP2191" /LENGTH=259 /DNA_ID=CAMNT_0005580421 /DNA_START=176 /DNA_END=955 /DNA_ORIENTATION=+
MSNVTQMTANQNKKTRRKCQPKSTSPQDCQLCYRSIGSQKCQKHKCLAQRNEIPSSHFWDLLEEAQNLSAWKTLSRFQGLATKLALLKLAGNDADQQRVDSLSALVHPRMDAIPNQWSEEHSYVLNLVLKKLLLQHDWRAQDPGSGCLSFFTDQWYASMIGRLHLNAISFKPHSSAVYGLPSFFNHSCDPNVVVEFDGAVASFIAHRDIQEGEECSISYYHSENSKTKIPTKEVEQHLYWNYGFQCSKSCTCGKYPTSQ